MKRIFQIRLAKITDDDFVKFFDFKNFDVDRINVQLILHKDKWNRPNYLELAKFGVFDLNHNRLGIFKIKQYSKYSTISFFIENNNNRKALLEYIRNLIEEMKNVGFTVQKAVECDGDAIVGENDDKPNSPKKEGNFEKSVEDTSKSSINDKSDDTSEEISTQANKPWEQINASENDKKMVRLIHEGLSATDIAKELNYAKKTIYNWSSNLRSKYGPEIVPYLQKWRNSED